MLITCCMLLTSRFSWFFLPIFPLKLGPSWPRPRPDSRGSAARHFGSPWIRTAMPVTVKRSVVLQRWSPMCTVSSWQVIFHWCFQQRQGDRKWGLFFTNARKFFFKWLMVTDHHGPHSTERPRRPRHQIDQWWELSLVLASSLVQAQWLLHSGSTAGAILTSSEVQIMLRSLLSH